MKINKNIIFDKRLLHMKIQLLSLIFLLSIKIYAQQDIEQLQSADGSQYTVMNGTIDQSATGANASWDFTSLSLSATLLTDAFTDLGGGVSVIETFDGATLLSSIDLETNMDIVSITEILSGGITATYTDTGIIGDFPLSFLYSNSDTVEGTFSGLGQSGTILNTSTINVNVDAWGNLRIGDFDGEVTRLTIIQNLNLSVPNPIPIFPDITFDATITNHLYYDANNDDLVFRFTRVQSTPPVVAPIDQILLEALSIHTLSDEDNQIKNLELRLTKNPVNSLLRFDVNSSIIINKVRVYDIMGRSIIEKSITNNILNVESLKSGIYVVAVETNRGVVSKKFIKE